MAATRTTSEPSNFPNTESAVKPATKLTPTANGTDLRAYSAIVRAYSLVSELGTRFGSAVNCAVIERALGGSHPKSPQLCRGMLILATVHAGVSPTEHSTS